MRNMKHVNTIIYSILVAVVVIGRSGSAASTPEPPEAATKEVLIMPNGEEKNRRRKFTFTLDEDGAAAVEVLNSAGEPAARL